MATKTRRQTEATVSVVSQEEKESVVFIQTLKAINQLRLMKEPTYKQVADLLDAALSEVRSSKSPTFAIEVLLRNLFFTFSIQREHNIWKREGVKSDPIGNQMRVVGRHIANWLWANFQDWLSKRDNDGYLYNLNLLVEYANYDLLTHNQVTTRTANGKTGKVGSKANPNKVVSRETMNIPIELVAELMAQNYRKNIGKSLIARWLPKWTSSQFRKTTLIYGKDIKRRTFTPPKGVKTWVNGELIDGPKNLSNGDKIVYQRKITDVAKQRIEDDKALIKAFCKQMGWTLKQYKTFRKEENLKTPEYLFSTKKIKEFKKDEFFNWLNGLTAGQQWVVSSTLAYKDKSGQLVKREGEWDYLGDWYREWSIQQNEAAANLRTVMADANVSKTEVKEAAKHVKTKVTGLQTVDLLEQLLSGQKPTSEVDTLYTTLLSKMEMVVPAYVIIDGSGSMTGFIPGVPKITRLDLALTLAITFISTNPVQEFRESVMWFGSETTFSGVTKYANTAPNAFVTGSKFNKTTSAKKVIDPTKPFSENLKSLRQANPGKVSSTNAGQVVTTFMKLVENGQMSAESLPKVLIFITDEEYNTGAEPVQKDGKGFTQMPQEIGWNPLFVFWGLITTKHLDRYKDAPNTMVVRGLQENTLSQILQFIKKGHVNMYDELFAVAEMPGLQLIKYS